MTGMHSIDRFAVSEVSYRKRFTKGIRDLNAQERCRDVLNVMEVFEHMEVGQYCLPPFIERDGAQSCVVYRQIRGRLSRILLGHSSRKNIH